MQKILDEINAAKKVELGIIAGEKLGGNLIKETAAKGALTGLLIAENIIREIAQKEAQNSIDNKAKVQICPCCDGEGRVPDHNAGGTKRCEHCKGAGKF